MEKSYNHLKPEERAAVMLMMRDGATVRSVARTLSRAPSTISRELKRTVRMDRSMRRRPQDPTKKEQKSTAQAGLGTVWRLRTWR